MCWEGERTWQERCTRRGNLTVDAQWDKMSMTRRNWRVVGESQHAPRWPLLSAKRAVVGVSPAVRSEAVSRQVGAWLGCAQQGKWPVMCQGVHDGVSPSGQETCGVSSGRGTCCAEGSWLGCAQQGKWPVMCQGVHDGVSPSGQETCGVSSGRGTCCAEGSWLGCPQQGKFILFLIAQKAKLERTTARGS